MTARREISRQEFLRISGRAAAGAAVGSTLLLATASGQRGGGRETALITDFGARGDGRHDDTKAILRAIDEMFEAGGGVVKVPATDAFYKTTRAIDLKSDMLHPVHIVGEGDKSFLKNVHQRGHDGMVFRPGRLIAGDGEFAGPGQTWHKIEDAEAGQDRIFPRSGRYKRGDMLFIASEERDSPGGGRSHMWWPLKPQIAIVEGVDERGALKLSDPLIYDYPGAEVAVYGHGASHGSVSNLRLEYEADGYNAFAGGGNYGMTFRNLNITGGYGAFGGNGYAHALIENIRGRTLGKGFELAYFTHSCTIRNIDIEPLPQAGTVRALFYLAQGSHHCLVEDVRLDHKDHMPDQLGTVFGHGGLLPGCRDNVVRRYTSLSERFAQGLNISGPADKPVSNNRLEDSTVIAKGAKYALRVSSGHTSPSNHEIVYNHLEAGETSVLLSSTTDNTLVAHNVVPQGVKDYGKNNTVSGNAKEDAAGVGPR